MSNGYTYEVWVPDSDPEGEPAQWGTFSAEDITSGPDLARVAVEIVTERLPAPPTSPAEGEFRLWAVATGVRIDGKPGYVADMGTLHAA